MLGIDLVPIKRLVLGGLDTHGEPSGQLSDDEAICIAPYIMDLSVGSL